MTVARCPGCSEVAHSVKLYVASDFYRTTVSGESSDSYKRRNALL